MMSSVAPSGFINYAMEAKLRYKKKKQSFQESLPITVNTEKFFKVLRWVQLIIIDGSEGKMAEI